LGHNCSIFLLERRKWAVEIWRGWRAPTLVAVGFWVQSLFMLPVGLIVLFGVGYASLATISVAVTATLVFAYRAWIGADPWQYIFYGIFTGILLVWALRPNLKRLSQGTERLVGLRARYRRSHPPNNAIHN
jgi:glycerol-3-phosphate acyltransferase PlsY